MTKAEFIKEIGTYGLDKNQFKISIAKSKSDLPSYNFNSVDNNIKYVIKIFESKGVLIIWNVDRLREAKGKTGTSVTLGKSWDNIKVEIDSYQAEYR